MDSSYANVLLTCAKLAQVGKGAINIFDLLYEMSMEYDELKPMLDVLIEQHKIVEENKQLYRYMGDYRSDLNMDKDQVMLSDVRSPNLDGYSDEEYEYADRQCYLEKKRQELIKRLEAELEAEESDDEDVNDDDDELYVQALSLFIKNGEASVGLLQREFGVAYGTACKVMDILEENGYISSSYESGFLGKRRVLISLDEFKKMFGDIDQ